MSSEEAEWPSVARQTIGDGLCIDWYRTARQAEFGHAYTVSASRRGVLVDEFTYLHTIPAEVLANAVAAWRALARDDRDGARRLATHSWVRGGDRLQRRSEAVSQ